MYLSPEQKRLGFSFRSLDGSELAVIKENYPKDYAKILKVYPFAEASVIHHKMHGSDVNGT